MGVAGNAASRETFFFSQKSTVSGEGAVDADGRPSRRDN